MNMIFKLIEITCFLVGAVIAVDPLERSTQNGMLRGTLERSKVNNSIEYYSFMGIPYAQPPIGNLRFKEPLPPVSWVGTKEANTHSLRCVQYGNNFDGLDIIGSEDCLYLNVFIPKRQSSNLKPVMFWIHGGNFIFGSGHNSGPDYVMEKDVVLVTIQYRLNVFGFFSTLDQYATGNFALKDQVMALKWVKENINNFGGDPEKVTILGESAGGASVQYHLLSTKSRGLFHRAISHSGSTLNRWAHQEYPREMALKLAKGLGIASTNTKEIVENLQKIDYKAIIAAAFNASIVGPYEPYFAQPFTTSIEAEGPTAFISESTYALLEKGIYNEVPYILGYNTEEGSFPYHYIDNGRADIDKYQTNPELLIPFALNVSKDSNCSKEVVKQIKSFYFENGPTNNKKNWINYMSYEEFVRGIRKSVELMYKHLPLYFYRFSYRGSRNESFMGGVGHHEELLYLWYSRNPKANNKETEADTLTRKRFVTMWTNFAATGDPTPETDLFLQNVKWPKVTKNDKIPFLEISDTLKIDTSPDRRDYEFWEQLFNLCGNSPYTGY